jgi:hypothetical protein
MDRQYIRDHQVIERYLSGGLAADEEQAFEEAYLVDPEILNELQLAERLREGLRDLNAAGGIETPQRKTRLSSWMSSPQYAAAASVLLAATLVFAGVLYYESAARDRFVASSAVTRLVPLVAVRGADANVISTPAEDEWIVLLIDPGFTDYDTYRAVLERRDANVAEPIWSRADMRPTYEDMIAVGLAGGLLRPGEYDIRLEGRMDEWPAERFDEISRTPFIVAAPDRSAE